MVAESTQFGIWERVGDEAYQLDPAIPAVRYRWHAPERLSPFVMDFQCTEKNPERRFYPVEVLSALSRGKPADDFVDRVCRFGIALLPEMETTCRRWAEATWSAPPAYAGKVLPSREVLEFVFALFKSRKAGHARVTRKFNRWDDFTDTTNSLYQPESLLPGIDLPKRTPKSNGSDVIRLIHEKFHGSAAASKETEREERLDLSPLRTPLDQIIVHGVFRDFGVLSFPKIIEAVAPALINGIEVKSDSEYLAQHNSDFRHFVSRLVVGYQTKKNRKFESWLRTESGKGFTRLLPEFKRFNAADRHIAREKGRCFYRRLLWTSYEAMSRCYGAVALWMWTSFCQSRIVAPSTAEQRAFRWYHSPLVCTGGLPLWFFGPNVLKWVLEPFITCVWGLRPDQEFDALTRLIGLYGSLAGERRPIDANKKRRKAGKGTNPRAGESAEQFEETAIGRTVVSHVPVVRPEVPSDGQQSASKNSTNSTQCRCGCKLVPVRDEASGRIATPTVVDQEILVLVECIECGWEATFRTPKTQA